MVFVVGGPRNQALGTQFRVGHENNDASPKIDETYDPFTANQCFVPAFQANSECLSINAAILLSKLKKPGSS